MDHYSTQDAKPWGVSVKRLGSSKGPMFHGKENGNYIIGLYRDYIWVWGSRYLGLLLKVSH